MSLEDWKSTFDIVAVALLFLTFVAGFGAWYFGDRLNAAQTERLRQFDKDLTEAKTELGEQQVVAADASARVAGLEKDVADAKTEMAKQQTRAADAERNLLEVQVRLAHRRINPHDQAEMIAKLFPYAGSNVIVNKIGEAEASAFADDILAVLTKAKWNITLNIVGATSPPLYGLQCSINIHFKPGHVLAEVLRPLPTADIHESGAVQNVGTITVGMKPPA